MKIKRIETRSFAISKKAEKELLEKAERKSLSRTLEGIGHKEEVEVKNSYLPLARFAVSRPEIIQKGVLSTETTYETRENYFYVDLSTLDLYYVGARKMGVRDIKTYDLLTKIIDLPDETLELLGELMKGIWLYYDEVSKSSARQLMTMGLIKKFKEKWRAVFSAVWSELGSEEKGIMVKDRVKVSYKLPPFKDEGFNLSAHLREIDTIVEEYSKDSIHFSTEKIAHVLSLLFQGDVCVDEVVFLPYIQGIYVREEEKEKITPRKHFPVAFFGESPEAEPQDYDDIREGVKLKPIALATEIGKDWGIPVEVATINFSDVADMEEVKEQIMEAIIYPLTNPELAKEFGKKGGGSILLYGPPGCGKSYIARATVGECGVQFFNVNISDLIAKGAETEAKSLHDVFQDAQREAPSIIFFDEIDAIGGRRTATMEYAEKMEIDQFLMEMDGVDSLGKDILIIAATNVPWNIDPALRRSVRFTKHIFVPPPNTVARIGIFKIHTKDKPLADDIDFDKLAELTEDYAASDLKAICDRATEIVWKKALEGESRRKITMEDFLKSIEEQESSLTPWFKQAQKELRGSGEEEIFRGFAEYILKYGGGVDEAKKPEIDFSDVGDMDDVKEEIRKTVVYPLARPDLAEEFKKEAESILLYGPPGCGKTYIARATAGECDVSFFNVNITDIVSKEFGESERNIVEIFERASRNIPAILFFDEIDAIGGRRELTSGTERRLINVFLTQMDGFKENKGLVVMAATNSPWMIDPALRRAGRFTKQLLISRPDLNARREIFGVHIRNKPVAGDINLEKLAELTPSYSSSDIKTICDRAAEIPWKEAFDGLKDRKITMDDFIETIKNTKSSLAPWYNLARKQLSSSGEKEHYTKLFEDMDKFEKGYMSGGNLRETVKMEREKFGDIKIRNLKREKEILEKKVEIAKAKYHKGEIDENVLRDIIDEYEKQLIDVELKLAELEEDSDGN